MFYVITISSTLRLYNFPDVDLNFYAKIREVYDDEGFSDGFGAEWTGDILEAAHFETSIAAEEWFEEIRHYLLEEVEQRIEENLILDTSSVRVQMISLCAKDISELRLYTEDE